MSGPGRGEEREVERMARNLILAAIILSAAILPSRTTASEDEDEADGEGQSLNGRKQQSAAGAPYEYSLADDDWPHILKTGCVK